MSKSKLVTADGQEMVREVPKIKGCQPVGSQVLVEMLTNQEMMGTTLHVGKSGGPVQGQAFQAYVLAVGPSLKNEDWGFKIGDRVLFDGMGIPVPNFDDSHRDKVIGEPHCIKGVLSEA